MANPPNLSGDAKGFDSKMFSTERAVRRGFQLIGYGVNLRKNKVPSDTVEQFQRDYNRCSDRFGKWGKVQITGKLDRISLNALEHAIRWSKKRENKCGMPAARSWRALCTNRKSAGCESGRSYSEAENPTPRESATNFVEVLPNGSAKLRNTRTDDALRCNIINFELHGDIVFALVEVPSQGDLPGGRPEPITCPCILGR